MQATNIAALAYQEVKQNAALDVYQKKHLKIRGPELGDGLIKAGLGAIDMIPGLQRWHSEGS